MQDSVESYLSEQVEYLQQRVLIYQDLMNGNDNSDSRELTEKNCVQKQKRLKLSATMS